MAFVASLAAAGWSLRRDLLPPGAAAWAVAVLPLLVGGLVIWSYVRFVREADELQRTIQLNALALAFGVTVVLGLAYPALELVGAPRARRSTPSRRGSTTRACRSPSRSPGCSSSASKRSSRTPTRSS